MIKHTTVVRVRYADTDQMKAAYYGRYFEYFEQGRSNLLREIGMPYPLVEEMGVFLPVIEAHATYRRPARYDDQLEIVTMLREMPVARVRLDYEVRREGEVDPIADGYTIHSFVNSATGRPTRAPAQFIERIEDRMKKVRK
jgi:acyl-CoA thioester hydrolase